jgi:hypothetical protein
MTVGLLLLAYGAASFACGVWMESGLEDFGEYEYVVWEPLLGHFRIAWCHAGFIDVHSHCSLFSVQRKLS